MPLSLEAATTVERPTLSLEGDEKFRTYSPQQLDDKTFKAMLGMNAPVNSEAMYKSAIANGDENSIRMQDWERMYLIQRAQREQAIQDFAAQKKGPVTPAEANLISDMLNAERDPNGYKRVWEQAYADKVLFHTTDVDDYDEALREDFDKTVQADFAGKEVLAKTEWMLNKIVDLTSSMGEDKLKVASDFLEGFVPLLDGLRHAEAFKQAGMEEFLDFAKQGTSKSDVISRLWELPMNGEFEQAAETMLDYLKEENTFQALDFADGFLNRTRQGEAFENLIPYLDVLDVVGLAVSAKTALKGIKALRHAKKTKAVTQSIGRGDRVEETLEVAGEVEKAAVVRSLRAIINGKEVTIPGFKIHPTPMDVKTDLDSVPSILDPSVAARTGTPPPKLGNKLTQYGSPEIPIQIPREVIRVAPEKVVTMGLDNAVRELTNLLKIDESHYKNFEEMVSDTRFVTVREDETKTGYVATQLWVTSPEGKLFKSETAAKEFAEMLTVKPAAIKQTDGGDWALVFEKPVDLSAPNLADSFKIDPETYFEPGVLRRLARNIQTNLENTGAFNRRVHKAGLHQQQKQTELFSELLRPITSLNKKSLARLETFVTKGRLEHKFYYGADFDQQWMKIHKQTPSPEERAAYEAVIDTFNTAWHIKNNMMHRVMSLQGRMKISVAMPGDKVGVVNAKIIEKLPEWNSTRDFFRLAIIDPSKKSPKIVGAPSLNAKPPKGKKKLSIQQEIDGYLEQGYKLIQVGYARYDPLKLGGNVHFAVVKPSKIENIDFKQLPYEPGGNFDYGKAKGFLKIPQVKMSRNGDFYSGDVTLYQFQSNTQGKRWEKKWAQLLELARAGKPVKTFIEDNFPFSHARFMKMVKKGIIDLSPDAPNPVYVRPGQSAYEGSSTFKEWANNRNFINLRNNEWDLDNALDLEGQRNESIDEILEIRAENGTVEFDTRPAEQVNPLTTAQNALQNAIRRNTLGKAAETSARHFVEYLISAGAKGADVLRRDPLKALLEFDPKSIEGLQDQTLIGKLQMMKLSTENLLGQNAPFSGAYQRFVSRIANSLDDENKYNRALVLTPLEMSTTSDFLGFIRGAAFHLKLGLGAFHQVFVQGQTFLSAAAIDPVNFLPAFSTTPALRLALINSRGPIVKGLASRLKGIGGIPEHEFLEVVDLIKENGWKVLRGSLSVKGDVGDPQMVRGVGTKVLDAAAVAFSETELSIRLTAYLMAYRRMRKALPKGAKLTLKDKDAILERASVLSNDMTRDANARWQQGVMSVPTQFYAYFARLTDNLYGTRLTKNEKIRLFLQQSLTYGVPAGAGLALPIYPFREQIKQWILENPDAKLAQDEAGATFIAKTLEDGVEQAISEYFGYELGYADRLGPSHIPILTDLFFGEDDSFVAAIGGASTSIGLDTIKKLSPFAWAAYGAFTGDPNNYSITSQDLFQALTPVSSWSNAARAAVAWNTGQFFSTTGTELGSMDKFEAGIFALTSVLPQRFNDIRRYAEIMEGEKEAKKNATPYVIKEYNYAMKALNDGDTHAASKHFKNMQSWMVAGKFTAEEKIALRRMAVNQDPDGLYGRIVKKFFTDAPEESTRDLLKMLELAERGKL